MVIESYSVNVMSSGISCRTFEHFMYAKTYKRKL